LDYCDLKKSTFEGVTQDRDYLVTAGGPASGKSTILEHLMAGKDCPDKSLNHALIKRAFCDPDESCLFKMTHTYLVDKLSKARSPQDAYEHWRNASNFLANVFLGIALDRGCAIAHGSTMATPPSIKALQAIKGLYHYKRTVVHVTCDEQVRKASEAKRTSREEVHCTSKDFVEKQKMFTALLADYIKCSEKVLFCYRGEFDNFVWAAKVENGKLEIYDQKAFAKIQEIHDAAQGSGFWKRTLSS